MRTRSTKAKTLQSPARDLAEEALAIVICNVSFDAPTIKALRLTCKRTKLAATARVKQFILTLEQDPEAVERSGLLMNIKKLDIKFNFVLSDDAKSYNPQHVSLAFGLLNLAVDVCSNSLEDMDVSIIASPQIVLDCASILGRSNWESLTTMNIDYETGVPGFLTKVLARPGSLPALDILDCRDPTPADLELLINSECATSLGSLTLCWSPDACESNTAPAMVTAMRNLVQKATNIDSLMLDSSTFEFLDCEQLDKLYYLFLEIPLRAAQRDSVDFAQALARPWAKLEYLFIMNVNLGASDLVRIFEADDTLPALKQLTLGSSTLAVDTLSCVRRPHLQKLVIDKCNNGHALLYKLIELIKEDKCTFTNLRKFKIDCSKEESLNSAIEALSQFLSCPCMTALEKISITEAQLDASDTQLISDIVNFCPNLTCLDLSNNKLGRPAVATLVGYAQMGAWPNLQKLGISKQVSRLDDPNIITSEHPYLQKLDLRQLLWRGWPDLECF